MPKDLTAADFSAALGASFRVADQAEEIAIRLETVTPAGAPIMPGGREPFSLLFRGPHTPFLPQATYRLESDVMRPVDVFLVPVGRDEDGHEYEAIFT